MICSNCESSRFISDLFCPHCGNQHESKMTIKQCHEINTDIANIHQELPDAEVFTGVLTDTHHYKRTLSNSSNKKEVGCWWITLDDGETKRQITINSENQFLDSLNKGDIVTIYRPTPALKTYNISGKKDQNTVTNNDWAPGVVLHNDKGQQSSLDRIYNPTPTDLGNCIKGALFLSVILTWALMAYTDALFINSLESFAVVTGIICIVLTILFNQKGSRRYKREKQHYQTIKQHLNHILNCNILDLQAKRIKRLYEEDDAICDECNTRIPLLSNHCFKCGSKNGEPAALPEIEEESMSFGGIVDATAPECIKTSMVSTTTDDIAIPKPSISARQRMKDEVEAITYSQSIDYTHKYAVGEAKGSLSGQIIFGTIIERDLNSSVKSWTEEQVETTTYRNGYGQEHSKSSVISRVNHRRSNLNGYLVIRTLDGEVYTYNPGSIKLGASDIGDHVLIGLSEAKFTDNTSYSYQQYYFNLSKDALWTNECITLLEKVGTTKLLNWLLVIAATGLGIYFSTTYQDEMMFIPLVMIGGVFMLMFKAVSAGRANKKPRQELANALHDKLSIARREREKWLSWLG